MKKYIKNIYSLSKNQSDNSERALNVAEMYSYLKQFIRNDFLGHLTDCTIEIKKKRVT